MGAVDVLHVGWEEAAGVITQQWPRECWSLNLQMASLSPGCPGCIVLLEDACLEHRSCPLHGAQCPISCFLRDVGLILQGLEEPTLRFSAELGMGRGLR